jgi:hypothetical protein
MKRITQIHA